MARTRQLRALRGALAAAVATFTALLGHVAGGGAVPGWLGIVAPLVLSTAVGVLLVGRRLSVWRLGLVVIVSQAFFHTLFVLGTPSTGGSGGSGAHHHGAVALPTATSGALTAADPAMTLGHAVAAALTIAALYRGELAVLALLRLVALIAAAVRLALRGVAPAPVPVGSGTERRTPVHLVIAPRHDRVVLTAPRRGPPALAH
jgi:hypothetical protein